MNDTTQPDDTNTDTTDTSSGGDDAARWASNAADLALIAAAGRGEASSHDAFAALHRLARQIVVAG